MADKNDFKDFMLKEYDYITQLFIANEQLGEKRVELFTVLTAAVLTLLGVVSGSGVLLMGKEVDPKLFPIGSLALFLFGIITLRRLIERNITTDKNTMRLDSIRMYFKKKAEEARMEDDITFMPFKNPKPPHWIGPGIEPLFSLRKGGLLENVVLLNSLIFTGLAISSFALVPLKTDIPSTFFVYFLLSLFVFVGSWLAQMVYVRRKYDREIIKAAGGLVQRQDSKEIAIVRRERGYIKNKNEWTLPKGKLQKGEGWKEAAVREVCEETGCKSNNLEIIDEKEKENNYTVENQPKVVLFWKMTLKGDDPCTGEIDKEVVEVKWLPLKEAEKWLVYDKEKALLRALLEEQKEQPK